MIDYFGLFKMFLLILGASIGIIHLRKYKNDQLAKVLLIGCCCVIILVFIVTGSYFYIENAC